MGTVYLARDPVVGRGLGVAKDESKAATLYLRACDASDAPACVSLGLLYSQGRGVKADPAKAHALFDKACNAGFARGCQLRDKRWPAVASALTVPAPPARTPSSR